MQSPWILQMDRVQIWIWIWKLSFLLLDPFEKERIFLIDIGLRLLNIIFIYLKRLNKIQRIGASALHDKVSALGQFENVKD